MTHPSTLSVSIDTAIILTGISKRTLWRRLAEGMLVRQGSDERGRTMIALNDLVPLLLVPVQHDNYELLVDADAGDADARNDLAQLFLDAGRPDLALHWFNLAVDQEHADAMHHLSRLHLKGIGVPKDEAIGLMWLAKAVTLGHQLGRAQIDALNAHSYLK